MRILVTGGTGSVGQTAVRHLIEGGHDVTVIGRREAEIEGAAYRVCDVTDYDCVEAAARGMDAIVHLAAIPSPLFDPGHRVYGVNTTGTYNAFAAAAANGIERVVAASSINALGYYFGVTEFPIRYFPIDEAHPTYTTDPYSFSKQIVEAIGAYFWRREGISSVCLRLPAVMESGRGMDRFVEFYEDHPDLWRDFGRRNFWTLLDDRDSALAIELGLTADYEGSHPLFVNDRVNILGVESEKLLSIYFPEVEARKHPIEGDEALVSYHRAKALIGFEPQHSWAEIVRSDDSPFGFWREDFQRRLAAQG
jgi:nucleoside-diphosphate-sugar epimerase